MIKLSSLFAACLLISVGAVLAQSPAPAKPSTPAAAASPAAALAVDDLDTLRAHLGETVDVRGTPTGTGHSKTGSVTYLNFGPAHKALSAVAFLSATASSDPGARKVRGEDDLKPFVGKAVIVHGKLADYKGDPQIVLDSIDQIKLVP